MSTAIFEVKATGMALKNDALRDAFALDGVRCFLLKRNEHSSQFTGTETTSGYRVKFDENRSESGLFQQADIDLDFRDTWAESTHIGYGVPDDDDEIEVFEFVEGEKDTIDPDASSVYWSARIAKLPNERYTIA